MDWETVYGAVKIHKTSHLVTYGGWPEGGHFYFYTEKDSGWYRWRRTWFQAPTYTKILAGRIATKFEGGGCEYIGVLPGIWVSLHLFGSDEKVEVLSDDMMQESQNSFLEQFV